MTRGLFISFEGIDGAGKSTHIDRVAQRFREAGRAVVLTREPGGTPLSESLRELVLHQPMDALTEALLMFGARREHLVLVIEPALARGDVLLCDRFTDASFAYQGGGRAFDWQVLVQLERMVQIQPDGRLRQPDLTVWFDLDPHIVAQRLASARVPDKFESQPADFFAAVRAAYAKRQSEMPERIVRIDAAQSIEAVGSDVSRVVNEWLKRIGA